MVSILISEPCWELFRKKERMNEREGRKEERKREGGGREDRGREGRKEPV
jgi:hypothetical protein